MEQPRAESTIQICNKEGRKIGKGGFAVRVRAEQEFTTDTTLLTEMMIYAPPPVPVTVLERDETNGDTKNKYCLAICTLHVARTADGSVQQLIESRSSIPLSFWRK